MLPWTGGIFLIYGSGMVFLSLAHTIEKTMPSVSQSWGEHLDVAAAIIGIAVVIIGWFIMRTLNKIDRNQTTMFQRLDALVKDFYGLKGEHIQAMRSHSLHSNSESDKSQF